MLPIVNTTPEAIVAEARLCIGVPYRHKGRDAFGLDCLGVLLRAAKATHQVDADFDFRNYTRDTSAYTLELELSKHMLRLDSWRDAQPGDVLLQKFHLRLPASHIIIVSSLVGAYRWGIHASSELERVVEQRIAHEERNHAAFRLRGVVHG